MIVCADPLGHCEECNDEALHPERHAMQYLGLAMTAPGGFRVSYFMPSVIDGNVGHWCKSWGKDISVNVITSRMV